MIVCLPVDGAEKLGLEPGTLYVVVHDGEVHCCTDGASAVSVFNRVFNRHHEQQDVITAHEVRAYFNEGGRNGPDLDELRHMQEALRDEPRPRVFAGEFRAERDDGRVMF